MIDEDDADRVLRFLQSARSEGSMAAKMEGYAHCAGADALN